VVAASLVVVGMWLKRMLIVVPVVTHPLIADTWGILQITWVAAGVTIGAAAAIPLLLMLFFKLFPVLSVYEMEELGADESEDTQPRIVVARQERSVAS
jgi:molybdopterin-containing oxidoreductase family membrane subunit